MKDKKINRPVVLVTPMDWGLGHATRCIPIITNLLAGNHKVIIAASGTGKLLLQDEFPGLLCIDIPGYNIHYSRKRAWLPFALLLQIPKIIATVYKEHRWLKAAAGEYLIDVVISDNRPGMFCRNVKCVYITHQLQIKTGNFFTAWVAKKIHYRLINEFNECWVPDHANGINLAGELSHPGTMPVIPVKYIGLLSRFIKYPVEKRYDLAIVLSGPEPQRSVFEALIMKDIGDCNCKAVLIRGTTIPAVFNKSLFPLLEIYDRLGAADLNRIILESNLVIGRCGYSTIMDLVTLQKKAVLVPTPGQTEQEYLADYLSTQKIFCCIRQELFTLPAAIEAGEAFTYPKNINVPAGFNEIMNGFLLSG